MPNEHLPIEAQDRIEALKARIAELEAAIATHRKERLPHMTNAHDRDLWSVLTPEPELSICTILERKNQWE